MGTEKFSLPDLALDEEAVFQNAFSKDLEDLKGNAAISAIFCDLFVSVCKASSLTLFTDKEAQTILQINDSGNKRLAVLKSVDDKGGEAMLMFYMLLHMNNQAAYEELPSSKDNDEKMSQIANLKNTSLSSIQNKIEEFQRSTSSLRSPGPAKPAPSVATVRPLNIAKKEEVDDAFDEQDVKERRDKKHSIDVERSPGRQTAKAGTAEKQPLKPRTQRGRWGIKKDDEFFHFVIVCFSLGAILVAEFIYMDWTVAAGIGLMSFAILETFGIYFGLVHRIWSIVQDLLPFFQKSPLGLKNQ